MVLDIALLSTQLYKVRIKGKVEQSRERSSTLPYKRSSWKGSLLVALDYGRQLYLYIYIYIYILKSVYLGCKLLRRVLFKTMEHYLSFLNVIFQVSLLFFLCRDVDGKGIFLYLLPKRFRPYFWLSSGIV